MRLKKKSDFKNTEERLHEITRCIHHTSEKFYRNITVWQKYRNEILSKSDRNTVENLHNGPGEAEERLFDVEDGYFEIFQSCQKKKKEEENQKNQNCGLIYRMASNDQAYKSQDFLKIWGKAIA